METGWERPCCRSGVSTTVCPVGPHPCSDTGVPAAASCAAASCLLPSSGLVRHLCPACPCFHLCHPYQHCQLLPSPGFAVSIPRAVGVWGGAFWMPPFATESACAPSSLPLCRFGCSCTRGQTGSVPAAGAAPAAKNPPASAGAGGGGWHAPSPEVWGDPCVGTVDGDGLGDPVLRVPVVPTGEESRGAPCLKAARGSLSSCPPRTVAVLW